MALKKYVVKFVIGLALLVAVTASASALVVGVGLWSEATPQVVAGPCLPGGSGGC